jgi:hypothetical protein
LAGADDLLQMRGFAPTIVAAAMLIATSGGCSIAQDRSCFTKRPSVVLPDRTKVLANLSNGGSGRAVAEAILDGRIGEARAMLMRDPRLLKTVVTHDPRMDAAPLGQSGDLLTFAVSKCDPKAVAMLLEAGIPADGVRPGNALALALLADTPDIAEQLLQAGASPDPLPNGEDAMAAALAFSHPGAVMTLLRHGADPRWADGFGIDRVRLAIDAEQLDIAELLIAKGGSIWTVAEDGSMAAHLLADPAIIFNSPEMNAARARLVAKAQGSGLPWPPPDRATVKRMVLSGQWPNAAMAAAGMIATPQALARMRAD